MTPNTTGRPVGYIRRSKVDADSPGDISKATQLTAIAARASIDGLVVAEADIFEDWGRSGRRSKLKGRPAYAKMRAAVLAGEVSVIYCYNWSRLGRSARDILDLAEECTAHGTAIVAATGAQVDPSTADGQMLLTILAAVDAWQAEVQAERTTAGLVEWRKAHPGEKEGRLPYGEAVPCAPGCVKEHRHAVDETAHLAAVIAAVTAAGSFLGACKDLKAAGVPTRLGGDWDVRTVARLFRRHEETLPPAERTMVGRSRGVAALRSTRLFGQLLRCACGTTLTSMPRAGSVGYYCIKAHKDRSHPRPYVVSERKVRAWAERRTDVLRTITFKVAPEAIAASARLDERRRLVVDMYEDSVIPKAERDARLAVIEAERVTVDTTLRADKIGARVIDWTADPGEVNAKLRALWDHVVMNGGMMPKRVVWLPTVAYGIEGPDEPTGSKRDPNRDDLRGKTSDELRAMGRRGDAE